jgi:hypothetical protein
MMNQVFRRTRTRRLRLLGGHYMSQENMRAMQGLNVSLTRESTFVAKGETYGRNTDFTEGLGTATAPLLYQEAVH